MYYPCSENKGLDLSLVFAYAKSRFSHEAAHIILTLCLPGLALPCNSYRCPVTPIAEQGAAITVFNSNFDISGP